MTTVAPVPGRFTSYLAFDEQIRVLVTDVAGAADETRLRHTLRPEAARVAAEGVVSAMLMSAHIKGGERVTLQVEGEKPLFALHVDVASTGSLRARLTPASLYPLGSATPPVLTGMVMVTKHDQDRVLYKGVAPIEEQTFESAMQGYLVKSQQTEGTVRLHARIDASGAVAYAAGILVEKMPGFESSEFQDAIAELARRPVAELVDESLEGTLGGLDLHLLESREVLFRCTCSKERARDILASLGADDLGKLLEERGKADLSCHFCREVYTFGKEEVLAILAGLGGAG
jgi:molecular chaperone Hsp33